MESVTEHFILHEADSVNRREHKLMIKMRSRVLKRPKCKSKLVMAVGGVCLLLFVATFIMLSSVSDEIEQHPYDGEFTRVELVVQTWHGLSAIAIDGLFRVIQK